MEERKKPINIVIATGIYPPEIGGPAFYAQMLFSRFNKLGHDTKVVTYGWIKELPTGLRHFIYFLKLIPSAISYDVILVLDTFSVALPAILAGKLFGKKIVLRIGGDFLWEIYLERTKEPILLSEFYKQQRNYSGKEKMIFNLTKFILEKSDIIVFTTEWQKNIMAEAYDINPEKVKVIENVYENRQKRSVIPKQRIILSPSRNIFLKNKSSLKKAFDVLSNRFPGIILDTLISDYRSLTERIFESYCVVVPSYSEVSPNIVLDALSLGVPVVLTSDCGLKDKFKNLIVWIDPLNSQSISDGVMELLDAEKYNEYMQRISKFSYSHSKEDVTNEFLSVFDGL